MPNNVPVNAIMKQLPTCASQELTPKSLSGFTSANRPGSNVAKQGLCLAKLRTLVKAYVGIRSHHSLHLPIHRDRNYYERRELKTLALFRKKDGKFQWRSITNEHKQTSSANSKDFSCCCGDKII